MNPTDIMNYGHQTVLNTVKQFPTAEWNTPGAVGYWSVKDVIAHLTSFEQVLVEILYNLIEPCPTPTLEAYIQRNAAFNDIQVSQRSALTFEQVYAEYQEAYDRAAAAAAQVSPETWELEGILPWYGTAYDLEDFIVYTFYGHKREHCGQIQTFSDRFK